jgi:hypothetical protein
MPHQDITATNRLLHDLDAVGRMQTDRTPAAERVEALLGAELAGVLRASLATASTPTGGLQPRRAA